MSWERPAAAAPRSSALPSRGQRPQPCWQLRALSVHLSAAGERPRRRALDGEYGKHRAAVEGRAPCSELALPPGPGCTQSVPAGCRQPQPRGAAPGPTGGRRGMPPAAVSWRAGRRQENQRCPAAAGAAPRFQAPSHSGPFAHLPRAQRWFPGQKAPNSSLSSCCPSPGFPAGAISRLLASSACRGLQQASAGSAGPPQSRFEASSQAAAAAFLGAPEGQ